jgi:hypothetical protein
MARYEQFNVNELTVNKIINLGGEDSGTGLSPVIWKDFPLHSMAFDPAYGITAGDDFASMATTGFPYAIAGANGTAVSLTTAPSILLMTAPGTDNDECYVTYNNALSGLITLNATKDWAFEARVKVSQITTAQGVFVGLAGPSGGVGVDFVTDNTMALKVIDTLGFQIVAATDIAAIWQTQHSKTSGARVAVNATAATAAVAFTKLGMKSVGGTVSFYVNGKQITGTVASSAANYPLNVVVNPVFATKCGTGAANTLQVDWWRAAQLS